MRFIMITVVLDMIAIGLIIPVLPALVGTFTQSQTEQAEAYRLVTLAFGVANFLCSPLLGALSDRFGRRPVLLIGMTGLSISLFTTAMATAFEHFVRARRDLGGIISAGGSGGKPVETISLNFTKIKWELTAQKDDGTKEGTAASTWDMAANKSA